MHRTIPVIATVSVILAMAGPRRTVAQGTPASGFAVWVRAPAGTAQDLLGSAIGAPQFTIGHRGDRLSVGVSLGLFVARASDKDSIDPATRSEESVRATAWQIGPALWYDVWRSSDARTRGLLGGGATLGRVSLTEVDEFRDQFGGSRTETQSAGTLLTVQGGVAGEHFLHSHFALGLEAGLRGTFAFGIKEEGSGGRLGASASGTYGALRAIVVF